MASIVDSIRSVYQDNYSLLKLGIFSYIMYLLYSLIVPSESFSFANIIIWILIFYVYSGFCSIIISNRIKQNVQTLPTLDFVLFLKVSSQVFLIAIPFALTSFIVVSIVVSLFNFEGIPQLIAIWLIRFFIFAIFITALINYSENYSIKDGFNVSKMLSGIADVLVFTVVCLLLIALYSLFVAVPTLYLIYNFFKIGPLFNYVAAFFVTINLAFLSDYWGQLYFDIESKNNYY